MPNHIDELIQHVALKSSDNPEFASIKKAIIMNGLRSQFDVSTARLKAMAYYMIHEMMLGLENADASKSTLKMLPSFVSRNDPHVNGCFYALDLGGTNFRVIRMVMNNGKLQYASSQTYAIPEKHMRGEADGLFDFIASCVHKFLKKDDVKIGEGDTRGKLGFTFSFPVKQMSINKGELIRWTKGFSTKGVEGKDVCQLLQKALDKQRIPIDAIALCNDTVGTLVARYFSDERTEMGVILGTGANACYWERASNIKKDSKLAKSRKDMIINMEFGGFDSTGVHVLPETAFDRQLDKESIGPGTQRLEKMISGFYLGEITRLILVSLGKCGVLPFEFVSELEGKQNVFQTKHMGLIAADTLPGLHFTKDTLRNVYKINCNNISDLEVVRDVCLMVATRSAQLAGMAIAATLLKARKTDNATVAVDGSVFEKTPFYRAILKNTIKELLGANTNINLLLQKDGSGMGAGFIAALTFKNRSKL